MDVGQKKTPIAPTPILENFSHVCVNYNGVTKPTPCNLNGIGVASRHRITESLNRPPVT